MCGEPAGCPSAVRAATRTSIHNRNRAVCLECIEDPKPVEPFRPSQSLPCRPGRNQLLVAVKLMEFATAPAAAVAGTVSFKT
jgi:hypothetical protein